MITLGSCPKEEKAKAIAWVIVLGIDNIRSKSFEHSAEQRVGAGKVKAFTFPYGKLWKVKAQRIFEVASIVNDLQGNVHLTSYGGVNLIAWTFYSMLRLQGASKLAAIAKVTAAHAAIGTLATWDTRELDKLVGKGGDRK